MERTHLKFRAPHPRVSRPFGPGAFGVFAEALARFFGTPAYLLSQTALVVAWIILNAVDLVEFDPYPFILLNLAFSLQAAYAAPLILLAETRQSDRDQHWSVAEAEHREQIAEATYSLLEQNTQLTQQVADLSQRIEQLTREVHARVTAGT